jgi:hypothetical protein
MSALLRIDGLHVEVRGRAIVDDVSFEVARGQIVAVMSVSLLSVCDREGRTATWRSSRLGAKRGVSSIPFAA